MKEIRIENRDEKEILNILGIMKQQWIVSQIRSSLKSCLQSLARGSEHRIIEDTIRLNSFIRTEYAIPMLNITDFFIARMEEFKGERIIRIGLPLSKVNDILSIVTIIIGWRGVKGYWVSIGYPDGADYDLGCVVGRILYGFHPFEQPIKVILDDKWEVSLRAALICLTMNLDGKGMFGPILDQAIEEDEYADNEYWEKE